MSRPPNQYRENEHTIDFRVGNPYDDQHSLYAQAGFPGYPQYTPVSSYPQPQYQVASPYPYPQQASLYPMESEAVVQDRIRSNIDAIMETQKTAMLNSKLEKLTNKVQNLTQNFEGPRDDISHIKSLSDKVDRLSRSIEARDKGDLSSNSEIAQRLRRLAAESRPEEHIPDW